MLNTTGRTRSKPLMARLQPFLYILPALVVVFSVIIFPLGYAFYISLHKVTGQTQSFVGLANYVSILRSDFFWAATGRTLYFTVVSVGLEFVLGLGVALLLNQEFPGRGLMRGLLILPWALPTVVNGVLWAWIFDANYGALNALLKQWGLIGSYVIWLGSPASAMNSVILADVWKNFPMIALLLLAGLQTIPDVLYEAAVIDGASTWRKFVSITLPCLKPAMLVALVLRTMEAFKVFDIIYIMTKGGPADGTQVISYYTYMTTFQYTKFGYGAALSYLVALVILIMALAYFRALRTHED
jgi:multiple sugar transport system permease protein/N,N'-diacetylchitobiose transport system permease protein